MLLVAHIKLWKEVFSISLPEKLLSKASLCLENCLQTTTSDGLVRISCYGCN